MITLVAEHWFKAEAMGTARKVFDENTEKLKKNPDFVSRLVILSTADPTKITTVTTWKTEETYKKFIADMEKRRAQANPNAPKTMIGEKMEAYQVLGSA